MCGLFCLLLYGAQAQQVVASRATDTTKNTTDSVFVPLKYCDIHKRSPVLACFLSVYLPGLGQVYNKQVAKGVIILGTMSASLGAAEIYYNSNKTHPHDEITVALLVPMAAAYIYSVIDAPVTAHWLNKTYHLGKKKNSLAAHIAPGLINSSPDHYTAGLSLVLR